MPEADAATVIKSAINLVDLGIKTGVPATILPILQALKAQLPRLQAVITERDQLRARVKELEDQNGQ